MKKLNKIKLHTKLITAGAIFVAVGNPLSLVFIADGADIAVLWLGQIIQLLFMYAVQGSIYFVLGGLLILVLGIGMKLGSDTTKATKKLKTATGGKDGMKYEL